MKKILLIIAIVLCIFQMVVLAVEIDIGDAAISGGSFNCAVNTVVNVGNPANASGIITDIEIWAMEDLENCEIAIFYVVSGNYLSTRDSVNIGTVVAGAKRTYNSLNLTVESGDFIGLKSTTGFIASTSSGGSGVWYTGGDQIPCTNKLFTFLADRKISLYGTGTTVVGWPHKWNTQTISKWNTKEFTKWNDLE